MIPDNLNFATMTLVLTPRSLREFGNGFRRVDNLQTAWQSANDLYSQALDKDFVHLMKSRDVSAFSPRWERAVARYSKTYDAILRVFAEGLGPSRFKLSYLKAIITSEKDLEQLAFGAHEVRHLYQRHIADSISLATRLADDDVNPPDLAHANALLRSVNFGLTLIFFFLTGNSSGPLWITLEARTRVIRNLLEIEQNFHLADHGQQIWNSLKVQASDPSVLDSHSQK